MFQIDSWLIVPGHNRFNAFSPFQKQQSAHRKSSTYHSQFPSQITSSQSNMFRLSSNPSSRLGYRTVTSDSGLSKAASYELLPDLAKVYDGRAEVDLLKVSSSLVLKCSVKKTKTRKKSREKGPPLLTQSFSLAILQRTNLTRTNPGKPLAAPNATHMADWGRKVVMIGCGAAVILWIC